MEPNEKKAFEPSGLVPRSIVRTFERFRQQLLPGSETAAIREYRISRYQVLVSARCLLTLLIIPIATNWLISSWLLSPLVEHFWNTQQNEIFLNSYQEERAFAELEFFSEKLFFDSLLTERDVKAMTIKMVDTEPFDQLVRHSSKTKDVKEIISPTMPELSFIGNTKLPTYSCPIDTARNAFGDRGIAIHTSPSQQDSHCLLRTFFEGNEYSKPSLHSSIGQILQPGMHRHFVQKQNDCNDGSNGNVRSLPSSVLRIVEVSNAKRVQGVRNTVGQGILKDYESISFSEDLTVLVNKVSFTELKKHQNPVPSVLRDYTTFVAFPFWSINSIRPITLNTSSDHNPLSSYTPFFLPYHKKAFLAESDLCIPIEEKKAPPGNQFLDRTCWYHTSQNWRFVNKMTPEDNYHSHTNNFLGGNLLTTHLSESRTTSQNLCLQCSIPNQLRKTNFCTTYGLAKLVDTARPLTITTFCPINDWTEGSYCTGSGTKMTSTAKEHFTMENEIDSLKLKEKIQEKILELAIYYNQQTISSITNIIGDLISILTLVCLFIWMKPEIAILKSFLVEAIYSLSDTTKSFLLILLTDLLVGFHSPRGWETALELLLKHFGLPENQDFVFLFVATFPVLLDTVFKYWIFRHLNKISPSTVATYHSMIE